MNKDALKRWLIAAGVRAVAITSLDWGQIAAVAACTAVVSVLTSIAGVPEVEEGTSPFAMRH